MEAAEAIERDGDLSIEDLEQERTEIEIMVTSMFMSTGITANLDGYKFLRESIILAVEDPRALKEVTKVLYPAIGRKFNTCASKVERSIRYAIKYIWTHGKIEAINLFFGAPIFNSREKPSNSVFIAYIAEKLRLERMTRKK